MNLSKNNFIMNAQDNNDPMSVEQFVNDFTNAFAELGKASEDAAKCFSSAIRSATISAIANEMERLILKYEQASFLTRWYWKRRIKKLCVGIDELKVMLNEL